MTPIRRQPLLAGPDIAPMAAPLPPPMPMMQQPEQPGGMQPDLGPLAQALVQRLSQNAMPGRNKVTSRQTDVRRKPSLDALMNVAGGTYA